MEEKMIKRTLDEIDATNYREVLKEAYKYAIDLFNDGFSGWRIPIFYDHDKKSFYCGSAISRGSKQVEVSNCGKQINAEVFSIEAQHIIPDYKEDEKNLKKYLSWDEEKYKTESDYLTRKEYIKKNDNLREDLDSEYLESVIDDVVDEYEDEFLRCFESYLYAYYLDITYVVWTS